MKTLPAGSSIEISTNKSKLDIDLIVNFISNTYWAKGRPREAIERGISNSACFGIYLNGNQIGFARVLSDYCSIAYLMDVFILEEFRGYGLGEKLVGEVINYQEFKPIKKWMLATLDMHRLYKKFGFKSLSNPDHLMEMFP
ncbi:MAG TPA: GNAT family N-acetyltransferase [Ignavibacteriaceae bacterium]|nr:GNAT family N-acetyltransferase [Ignavibacteriaceae bacterium]